MGSLTARAAAEAAEEACRQAADLSLSARQKRLLRRRQLGGVIANNNLTIDAADDNNTRCRTRRLDLVGRRQLRLAGLNQLDWIYPHIGRCIDASEMY